MPDNVPKTIKTAIYTREKQITNSRLQRANYFSYSIKFSMHFSIQVAW